MPDFSAQWVGPTITHWRDPADTPTRPSRINPIAGREHRRLRCSVGELVQLIAVVNGVSGPPDSSLGGRLFVGWFTEWPGAQPVATPTPGSSSVRTFTPTVAGHYTYALHRKGGGGVILHVDVVAA